MFTLMHFQFLLFLTHHTFHHPFTLQMLANHGYQIISSSVTWGGALGGAATATAVTNSGQTLYPHLATIETASEDAFLRASVLPSSTTDVWVAGVS